MPPTPVVSIVQARMGSRRLPGKVLEDIAGEPMLARVMDRLGRSHALDRTVVATTEEPIDEPIVELGRTCGWTVHRGPEEDVLERFRQVIEKTGADPVVRITADCPFIDPAIVDHVIGAYEAASNIDYCSNTIQPRTFPRGMDTEVIARSALLEASSEATLPSEREHVTPFIRNQPDRFTIKPVHHETDLSEHRLTVDEEQDLELAREVYSRIGTENPSMMDVIDFLEAHPEIARTNDDVQQKETP